MTASTIHPPLRPAIIGEEPPHPPRPTLASALSVVKAFFSGKLRQRFFADARDLGDIDDATRRVGSGYLCLAGAVGWAASLAIVLLINPLHIQAHLIGVLMTAGCFYAYHRSVKRADPSAMTTLLVFAMLISISALSYRNAGLVAPIVWTLPLAIAAIVLFLRGRLRMFALLGAGATLGFIWLTVAMHVGVATTYTPDGFNLMTGAAILMSLTGVGAVMWIAVLSRDFAIEQAALSETAMRDASDRSRGAMEAAKVGLWEVPDATTVQTRRFHVSESFETITGYTGEEFTRVFDALEDFVHKDDILQLREAFALGRKRMSRLRTDFRLKTKMRGYRWFSARAKYTRNADGTIRISGSMQDINFIKAAEEALRNGRDRAHEANRQKSDFIAMMSHEVRTPLNAILGSVEVLKRREHEPDVRELVGLIDDAGRGLMAMVNDLLDVSKIEAGKLEFAPEPVDLTALVSRTVDFWRPQAAARGLVLECDCANVEGGRVLVDPIRLRQILGNLVSNAIKFTDDGSVSIRLTTATRGDGRIDISLSVIDTGSGVPDQMAETIFAPFEQVAANASRGGTGLGLFISRRLARLMGGDVMLEAGRASGSHFRLELVADSAHAADRGEGEAQAEATMEPVWSGRHVLCVDDHETNRRIVHLLLEQFGIEVTACASGAEALDLTAITGFDVILMDIVMPGMSGVEALKRLRADASNPNVRTPVIALTAKLAADDMSHYDNAGFDGVAGKPINVRELVQAIAPFFVDETPPLSRRA